MICHQGSVAEARGAAIARAERAKAGRGGLSARARVELPHAVAQLRGETRLRAQLPGAVGVSSLAPRALARALARACLLGFLCLLWAVEFAGLGLAGRALALVLLLVAGRKSLLQLFRPDFGGGFMFGAAAGGGGGLPGPWKLSEPGV